jgi:ADP-ribosylglycohydrolase
MKYPLNYPEFPDYRTRIFHLMEYVRLKYEYGADREELKALLNESEKYLEALTEKVLALKDDPELTAREPDNLDEIRALRPEGPRKMWKHFDEEKYAERLKGAFMGRLAGCTLGAPVEFWPMESMKNWAEYIGDDFPPTDYWSKVKNPNEKRYLISDFVSYTRDGIKGVPVDDDVTYTLLGLLIAEEYGLDFTVEDVGAAWLKYLPLAYTAEEITLRNLKEGIPAEKAAEKGNPFVQWIGADIRSDPWGYLAPGYPEKAAEMAYRDASLSHRRNGIYGEMFFSAAIAAAFETGDPVEALHIGLTEIPEKCMLAEDVRWALKEGAKINNYLDARKAVQDRFGDMSGVHTNLNACLTIFGVMIGREDFTRVIGETVAMGYDNDCTAATAGSLAGAAYGIGNIPEHWYKPFNNTVLSYMNGVPEFRIDDVLKRFAVQAKKVFE